MKMNGEKLTALLGTAVLAMDVLAGCGSTTIETATAGIVAPTTTTETTAEASAVVGKIRDRVATEAESVPSADLSGTISMAGPIPMEKLANTLSESFMERHPNVTVTVEFVGSDAGIRAVSNGTANISDSSRNLKDEEKAGGVVENTTVIDGTVVAVDGVNTVEDPTERQLSDIYEEKIINWGDAGGNDVPIVVIGRESGPDTRSVLEELLKSKDMCKHSNKLDNTGVVVVKVVSTPGAIGYVPLDVPDDTVKVVKLEGTEPTGGNIEAGSYFLNRPFVIATKGDIGEQNELVKAPFDYIRSDESAETVKSVGLIVVDK